MRKNNDEPSLGITIGMKLKEARLKSKCSQKAIAEKLGVSYQQIQKYETGKTPIPISRLLTLTEILGISLKSVVPNISRMPEPDKSADLSSEMTNLFTNIKLRKHQLLLLEFTRILANKT